MKRHLIFLLVLLTLCSGFTAALTKDAQAATHVTRVTHAPSISQKCVNPSSTTTLQGTLGGANYTIQVPSNWNGTLALYSHGYVFTSQPLDNPAPDAGDTLTAASLLQSGYALAGSSYSQNGWALQQAFSDQIALLDFFNATCGHPSRTIAWGHSLGGIITAGLVQLYPSRFNAALPMCGVLAGGIGTWNQALDGAFAFNVLLANSALQIVHITDPTGSFNQAESALSAAQNTAQGKARIALLSALSDIPGWFDPTTPEPTKTDYATQEQNQFLWESQIDFLFSFYARAELESRAGGNPSWNTNVNYHVQLAKSVDNAEVRALYQQAGLNLNSDLNTLNAAPRIKADPQAVNYLNKYITFNGNLNMPVLSMHTTGDGLVVNEQEQAYDDVVDWRGNAGLLNQIFVHRAGHCTFTPAETVTAFQTLIQRLNTGTWGNSTNPTRMNNEAIALGSSFNPVSPAFINYDASAFLRPYDAHNQM